MLTNTIIIIQTWLSRKQRRNKKKLYSIYFSYFLLKNHFLPVYTCYSGTHCRSRLSLKQNIPSKRNTFRIQSFVLCNKQRVFILKFIIYDGSLPNIINANENIGKFGNIVAQLLRAYFNTDTRCVSKIDTRGWFCLLFYTKMVLTPVA